MNGDLTWRRTMTCPRGKANPDQRTKLRLFADSGGICQKPGCPANNLFLSFEKKRNLVIAEIAHVFSAGDAGPRAKGSLTDEERGAYENLILLCPTCHTIIDKAEEEFPDDVVLNWKRSHRDRIAALFGVQEYFTRGEARDVVEPLLLENATVFASYGPETDESLNPESEVAAIWRRKVLEKILPNNQRIMRIADANTKLLTVRERQAVEKFRQHLDDLTARHIGKTRVAGGSRFPSAMSRIFGD